MSYTYLLAAGAESSAACFSDIPPSVLSRLNLTAVRSSCSASAMASSHASPSGMTFAPSTDVLGAARSMPSAVVSPVKTSAAPANVKASRAKNPDSGNNFPGSLAKWHPATSSWKTPPCSRRSASTSYSGTWPKWGMMRGGELLPQPMLAPPICGNGFGFLPTPVASLGAMRIRYYTNALICQRKQKGQTRVSGSKIGFSLAWHPEFINEALRSGGEINPRWIELLMGWPIDWTALKPLAMARFRKWQRWPGGSSKANK